MFCDVPWVPATLRVWQPPQRSANSWAPGLSAGVTLELMLSLPQAARAAAAATTRKTGRAMRRLRAMTEYKVSPLTSYVKPGKLTITARNEGKLAHNVAVIREGDVIVGRSSTMNPGQTATIKVSLDPGTYRVLSSLSNDDPLGINGYIVVKAAG